jgi:hypothetical protein
MARKQAKTLAERYGDKYPKAIEVLPVPLCNILFVLGLTNLLIETVPFSSSIHFMSDSIPNRSYSQILFGDIFNL